VWGGLFSTFDCTLVAIRRKGEPLRPYPPGPIDYWHLNSVCRPAIAVLNRLPFSPHIRPPLTRTSTQAPCLPVTAEDPWNSIAAGALTGGFLQLRTGMRSAAKSAAFGGVLLVRLNCRHS
jgi:hypothetical protein